MGTHAHAAEIRNPGPYQAPSSLKTMLLICAVIGIAAFAAGVASQPTRAWSAFVQNHFYFMSLAIGGLFFAAIQWLTAAMWSAPVRRIAESFTAWLPGALVSFIVLYFGMKYLYIWTHADHVKGDLILEGKAGYLNTTFFVVRNVIALGIWMWFAKKLVGNSIRQDTTKDGNLTVINRRWTPAFLIFFALSYTMAAFDLLMSLDPHWFSTMFGVYCFAGLFYSVLALICLMAIFLRNTGHLKGLVTEDHLHDLGKFMFAFSVFYAYIAFCQFLLIWYANLPEETGYYLHRIHGGWGWVSIFLFFKWLVPFFVLMPRDSKRNPKILKWVAIFMLIANWVDMLWLVQPEFFHDGPRIGWIEIGVTLGFMGLFGTMMMRFLGRQSVMAIGEPKLAESQHHHQ